MSRFRFVSEHRHAYGVKRLCRAVGLLPLGLLRLGGPAALESGRSATPSSAAYRQVHQRSRRTYGAPRIHAELAVSGSAVAESASPA